MLSPGGFLFILLLWGLSVIPGRFTRGYYRAGKAIPLARQALVEEELDICLRSLRESVLQSFLFKAHLRFNSMTMRVPEGNSGFLEYFRQTFLPEEESRLRRLEGRKSKLWLATAEELIIAAPIILVLIFAGLDWIAWFIGAALLLASLAYFVNIYGRFLRREREYAEIVNEVDLKLAGYGNS